MNKIKISSVYSKNGKQMLLKKSLLPIGCMAQLLDRSFYELKSVHKLIQTPKKWDNLTQSHIGGHWEIISLE